jgi:hypothetical protein
MIERHMKKSIGIVVIAVVAGFALLLLEAFAAGQSGFQQYEYATIRWGGRENTHIIRPNGQTEILGPMLNSVRRPDRIDERAFYMNIALNAAAKEGYELAAMTNDEFVLRRPLNR